jgi:hypothetical protein
MAPRGRADQRVKANDCGWRSSLTIVTHEMAQPTIIALILLSTPIIHGVGQQGRAAATALTEAQRDESRGPADQSADHRRAYRRRR